MADKSKKEGVESFEKFDIKAIRQALDAAENQISLAKQLLFANIMLAKAEKLKAQDEKVIEGIFDGEGMMGADKKRYLVPPNYASKSKLLPGDVLKLKIEEDGTYLYKQISPMLRKRMIGRLCQEEDRFYVNCEGKNYDILKASVSYFKVRPGDKIAVIIPRDTESKWAAVENVISK